MNNIINLNTFFQYKFLYTTKPGLRSIYHVWGDTEKEIHTICKYIQRKKNFDTFGYMVPSCSIRKNFKPIPFHHIKQFDNLYHAYVIFENFE